MKWKEASKRDEACNFRYLNICWKINKKGIRELKENVCNGFGKNRIPFTFAHSKRSKTHRGVAEWSIAAVLKTVVPWGTGGSNPSSSARQNPNLFKNNELGFCFLIQYRNQYRFLFRFGKSFKSKERPIKRFLENVLTNFLRKTL